MYTVAFDTFGCRLNQAETATLCRQMLAKGYHIIDDPLVADLYVINTCGLTERAASKCRRRIRSVIRRNPGVCVAAIGCYAQTDAGVLKNIEGLDYIIGTADKLRLADIIPVPAKLPQPQVVQNPADKETFTIAEAGYYPWNTRANIKIQEGCDFVCAYCIVPRSRGPARSREFDDVLKEARALAGAGHRELVITGVNIGTYEESGHKLSDVLRALAGIDRLDRIRLSSIEPTTIDDDVIAQMAEGGKLCPYLHVPAQSGDDRVLRAMRRNYDSAGFRRFIEKAVSLVPNIGLGTDIMVGFPGEDEEAFDNSCDLMRSLPFNNIHVFSFSARPRTSAHKMPDKVPADVIRERSAAMHDIAEAKKTEFYQSRTGTVTTVLFEERDDSGRYTGFTGDYIKVAVETPADLANKLRPVRITGVERTDQTGSGAPVIVTGDLA